MVERMRGLGEHIGLRAPSVFVAVSLVSCGCIVEIHANAVSDNGGQFFGFAAYSTRNVETST
jgi:hypothetical protein